MDIITSHVHLDLDGLASMVLAKKLYPEAKIVLSGDVGENLKELINFYQEELSIFKASEVKLEEVENIILVDTSASSRIGKFSILTCPRIIFDHHLDNTYGANTTLLLQEIFKKNINLSTLEATIALMGIYEDTGSFSFKNTSYYDMEAGAKLLKMGANLDLVIKYVSKSLTQKDLDFMLLLMKKGEILEINHHKVFITSHESDKFYNGIDVLINKIMEMEGSEACFIIHGNGIRNSIIGRSTTNKIPVNKVLSVFSNGGHTFASSTVVKNRNIDDIKSTLKIELEKNIEKNKLAKDIMKSPVKTIESKTKLKDAFKLMTKFSYSGFPITEEGKLVGIISRRDVEKAVSHGFGNAPAKAYMTRNIVSGKLNSTLEEIKKMMVEKEISRIPIVSDNDELLGLITRSDLLEGMYNENLYKNSEIYKNRNEFYTEYIKKLPIEYETTLKIIEQVSKSRNENCYLVGGIVRDLLLNIANYDLDIVVEGNAIAFGKELIKHIEYNKIIEHEQFRTCVIVLKSGLKIDIASSRIEYYEYPTSLPTVEFGNIKEDLYRRDFTINSMAIKLSQGEFGKLLDYYGGYKDLRDKKIRILHNLSFIEDPTRVIRAIRFAVRYDFTFEDETYKFMKEAINEGFLNNLSWQRFKNELVIMLKEKSFIKAINYLNKLKIIDKIHANIKIDEKIKNHLLKAEEMITQLEYIKIKPWIIYLLIILEDLDRKDLYFIFTRFTFKEDFIKKYDYGKKTRKEIKSKLESSYKNSQIYELLEKIPDEIIALVFIEYEEVRDKINIYFSKIKNKKPLINGKDLIQLGLNPGYLFKSYLNNLYKIQLDNEELNKESLIELWKEREM